MSRVGKEPIPIPDGVKVDVQPDHVSVEGPRGKLELDILPGIEVRIKDGEILVARASDKRRHRSLHGLSRTLIANMVEGVTKGFQKRLEIHGVGYRASLSGKKLTLQLGYSHPIVYEPPDGINLAVDRPTLITIEGIDKQLVGQVAATIRAKRKPEPYKGKGIRYEGERVRLKAGKSGIKA